MLVHPAHGEGEADEAVLTAGPGIEVHRFEAFPDGGLVLPEFPLIEKGGVEALHLLDRHGIEDTAVESIPTRVA